MTCNYERDFDGDFVTEYHVLTFVLNVSEDEVVTEYDGMNFSYDTSNGGFAQSSFDDCDEDAGASYPPKWDISSTGNSTMGYSPKSSTDGEQPSFEEVSSEEPVSGEGLANRLSSCIDAMRDYILQKNNDLFIRSEKGGEYESPNPVINRLVNRQSVTSKNHFDFFTLALPYIYVKDFSGFEPIGKPTNGVFHTYQYTSETDGSYCFFIRITDQPVGKDFSPVTVGFSGKVLKGRYFDNITSKNFLDVLSTLEVDHNIYFGNRYRFFEQVRVCTVDPCRDFQKPDLIENINWSEWLRAIHPHKCWSTEADKDRPYTNGNINLSHITSGNHHESDFSLTIYDKGLELRTQSKAFADRYGLKTSKYRCEIKLQHADAIRRRFGIPDTQLWRVLSSDNDVVYEIVKENFIDQSIKLCRPRIEAQYRDILNKCDWILPKAIQAAKFDPKTNERLDSEKAKRRQIRVIQIYEKTMSPEGRGIKDSLLAAIRPKYELMPLVVFSPEYVDTIETQPEDDRLNASVTVSDTGAGPSPTPTFSG